MIKDKLISLKELERYIELIQLEQAFRVRLGLYKELKEFELDFLGKLKPMADKLKHLRHLSDIKVADRELDREIRNMINKKFIGGVLDIKEGGLR